MRIHTIRPLFVEYMPEQLQDGLLYISLKYQTASHRCCCGCGTRVVTPLRETEFTLSNQNGLVSLYPSIGNWNHPCRSHYWIINNNVTAAATMSRPEIQRARAYDDAFKERYFGTISSPWWKRAWARIKALICD